MSFWTAVVIMVFLVMGARVMRARYDAQAAAPTLATDPEARRLRQEVQALKERIAVLERLATDDNSSARLDREIEKLRDGH